MKRSPDPDKVLRNDTPFIDSYTPSDKVRAEASKLLEKYPEVLTPQRMDELSHNIQRDGMVRGESGAELSNRIADNSVKAGKRKTMRAARGFGIGTKLQTAAGDIMTIPDLVQALSKNEPLKASTNGDNPDLLSIFRNAMHPDLPPPVSKCLATTIEWCKNEMRALTNEATNIVEGLQPGDTSDFQRIRKHLQYLDSTAGVLFEVNQLTDMVSQEIKAAQQALPRPPKGRGAA